MLRRVILVPFLVAFVALLSAGSAWAGGPAVPKGDTTTSSVDAGQLCPFAITITITTTATEPRHILSDGTQIFTGPGVATISRDTGQSVTYNISGPGTISADRFFVLKGQSLIFQFAADNVDPFLRIYNGLLKFQEGQAIQNTTGFRIAHDVCAELA